MTAEYRKIRGNEIEPKSVHTDRATIRTMQRANGVTTARRNSVPLSETVQFVDTANDRLWTYYGANYSDDDGDTWTATGDTAPERLIGATTDYIFAATENPLEIHRSPYSLSGFNFSSVLSFSNSKTERIHAGTMTILDINHQSGRVVVAPYGSMSSSYNVPVYRSDDEGKTWTKVWDESNGWRHCHGVRHNPLNPGEWVLTFGDDGNIRYLHSTDDAQTFEKKQFGPETGAQSVGMAFGEDYLYFTDDKGSYKNGPWAYHRETGETVSLCSEHPVQTFDQYIRGTGLQYTIEHDTDEGVTYFEAVAQNDWWVPLCFVRYIGDKPQMLDKGFTDTDLMPHGDYVYFRDNRYGKITLGGDN